MSVILRCTVDQIASGCHWKIL